MRATDYTLHRKDLHYTEWESDRSESVSSLSFLEYRVEGLKLLYFLLGFCIHFSHFFIYVMTSSKKLRFDVTKKSFWQVSASNYPANSIAPSETVLV